MVTVRIKNDEDSIEVRAAGHALFDKKGTDIVCASISVLLESWYLSEKELCGADIKLDQAPGRLDAKISNYKGEQLLLFKSLVLSLKALENQYPQNLRIDMED